MWCVWRFWTKCNSNKWCEKNVSFRNLFEIFISDVDNYPVLKQVKINFVIHSEKIIEGKPEFVYHKGWLDIYWPPGELEYIRLVDSSNLDTFYDEAFNLLVKKISKDLQSEIIKDAVYLNKELMRLPNKKKNNDYNTNYNIYDVYNSILKNEKSNLKKIKQELTIIREDKNYKNFNEWLQKIIWYGHRSGDYLCKVKSEPVKKKNNFKIVNFAYK